MQKAALCTLYSMIICSRKLNIAKSVEAATADLEVHELFANCIFISG